VTQPSREGNAQAARLSAALDEHRDELTRLPGVIGTGVGLSGARDREDAAVVIQIFVSPSTPREVVEQQAARILGRESPIEVVQMPLPQAQPNQPERRR
jgi:hypothetical protein